LPKENIMSPAPRTVVDPLPPVYASHFLLTVSDDCLFIESSAGPAAGETGGSGTLPILGRMAVPLPAAQRLAAVLNAAIAQRALQATGGESTASAPAAYTAAHLPRLEV
jgi:hypothetical protein